MIVKSLYEEQSKKCYKLGTRLFGTVILRVLCVVLFLFAFSCIRAEAGADLSTGVIGNDFFPGIKIENGLAEAIKETKHFNNLAVAATGSPKLLHMKTIWENVDLNIYSRYNGEYRALGGSQASETVFGKTGPGKTIKLKIYPENRFKGGKSSIYFGTYKIQKGFPKIASKDYERKTQSQTQSFTIPKGVEMVIVHVYMTWTAGDPNNPLYDDGLATRHYVLFTSDDAFRRAYQIFTGKKLNQIVPPKTNLSQDKNDSKEKTPNDKKSSKEKQTNVKNALEKKTDEKKTDEEKQGYYLDTNEDKQDDLPESDVGKVAIAVGTALAGGLLGLTGAVGGMLGGGVGGAAGSIGGYGPNEGGYAPEEGGYGPDEGGYGPDEGGYGPDEGGYGPDEGGYGPEEGGYGPDEGGYGPDEGGYGPDEGGYGPDEGGYGPDEGDGQSNTNADIEDADEEQDETDADNEDADEEQDETDADNEDVDEEQDETDADNEDVDEEQDETDADNEDADEEQDDTDADNEDADEDDNEPEDNYQDAEDDQSDVTETKDEPAMPDDTQDGPTENVRSVEAIPDNLAVDDDGSIHVMVPSGEELVYTRNEDGTYNMPTQTETGENLTYFDEDGNVHLMEPGMLVSQEQVLADAQWYKDHEQEILADRAEEDARQQAERDRLAAENAKWQEKERAINSQLSRTSIETQEALRQLENKFKKDDLIYDMRWQYAHGDESISVDDLKKLMKKEQLKNRIEGGYHDMDAAKWDDRIVTAQEIKFVADQSVNAYSTLTHNQAFANMYNAATNYGETMMDAVVNKKDLKKAFVKATIDTGLDMTANKLEDHGWHVTGNAFAGAYKQVNDNLYNGRNAWEGTDEAALRGGAMGAVGKGMGKLNEMSQGTVLGKEIGSIGPNTRLDFWNNPKVGNMDANIPTGKVHTDVETGGMRPTSIAERRMGEGSLKPNNPDAPSGKVKADAEIGKVKPDTNVEGNTSKVKPDTNVEGNTGKVKPDTNVEGNTGKVKPDTNVEGNTGKVKPDTNVEGHTDSTKPNTGGTEYKNQSPASDAETRAQINEDLQGGRAMNEVRKLYKISEKMASMEKANPKGYQNDPEYQKLSEQFDSQARTVRENKLSIERLNLLQGKTGTDLRSRYNKSDIAYEQEVLKARNESLAEEYGLKPEQIGDFNVTSKKIEDKLAGGMAGNDTDTSPYVKVNTGEGKNAKVDFTQIDGDHHLARAIYKAEHGRYPQTAAEYDEALRLKQLRDFTNVSTRPSDTHESYRNPDAYVGSGKGDVNKVLHPEKYGTPEKGTGVFNEQTAIHKQGTPLERHQQQYVEAQKLREQLKTDTNLSATEKTAMGKRIADLEYQSASNHYESVRTTAKEFNVINRINDVNIKNGLGDGLSSDAKQIGKWANQVAKGEMDAGTYKKLVTEKYGSEENALKIVAKGFRDTNL